MSRNPKSPSPAIAASIRDRSIVLVGLMGSGKSTVGRRSHRPLLKDRDPGEVLRELAAVRNPIYAEAHLRVSSASTPHDHTVRAILEAMSQWKA